VDGVKFRGGTVFVGKEVAVGIAVGGMDVAVGMAAWVSATMVIAAAIAVPCTSAGDIVGSGSGPHAVNTSAAIAIRVQANFINRFSPKLKFFNLY
jgi:hypothetical protein